MAQETKLKGYKVPHESGSALPSNLESVTVKAEFRPGSFRSGTEREAEVAVGDDELVEVEFEDGLRIWLTAAEYREKLEKEKKRAPGATGRSRCRTRCRSAATRRGERGIVGWVLKSLKVVGVDVAGKTAVELASVFEDKKEGRKRPGPGLYRCRMVTGDFALEDLPAGKLAGKRVLLFLHGTASSTWGSFGELWSPARIGDARRAEADLRRRRHRARPPLDDREPDRERARDRARRSRAACRRCRDRPRQPFARRARRRAALPHEHRRRLRSVRGARLTSSSPTRLARRRSRPAAGRCGRGEQEALAGESDKLKALAAALGQARRAQGADPQVRARGLPRARDDARFPTARPLGADPRQRRPASPRPARPSASSSIRSATSSPRCSRNARRRRSCRASRRCCPRPGFVRMVNNPRRTVASELAVIAGDIEPEGIWKRLLMLLADRFYAGEHDLVVNTGSMYGGAPRATGKAALCPTSRAPRSTTSTTSRTPRAPRRSSTALGRHRLRDARQAAVAGFEPLRPPEKPIAREVSRGPAGPRPVVFVLPGIMGSELEVNGDRVWIDFVDLFAGGSRAASHRCDRRHATAALRGILRRAHRVPRAKRTR